MQVSPINSTSFSGKFLKTTELEILLKHSDKNTLFKFNEILERARNVDDKKIFKISSIIETKLKNWEKLSTYHFHLISHPENNKYRITVEDTKSFQYKGDTNKVLLWNNYESVLKSFIPLLEKIYPKTDFKESHDELIQKINKNLIF